jgi:hypothetical protein
MKKKKLLGITLILGLLILSASVMVLGDDTEDSSNSLKDGEDSPGNHQCPRDGYDSNKGSAYRKGF